MADLRNGLPGAAADAARAAYDQAIAACGNDVERAHLHERRRLLG